MAQQPVFKEKEKDPEKEDQRLSNTSGINEDIIFVEILTRLHVASLLRCKAVSKTWYIRISDPSFVAAHLERSRKKLKIAIIPAIEPRMFKIYGCEKEDKCFWTCIFQKEFSAARGCIHNSNGLFLVIAKEESFICNPSTRDYTILPRGGRDSSGFSMSRGGFGFVPGTNVVKVAQYFYRSCNREGGTYSIGFEVLTFGVDSSWRVMAKDPPYPIDAGRGAISASGAIYFKIDNALHTASPEYVLSFDLKDEEFTVIHRPCPLSSVEHPHAAYWLTGIEDTLCFVHQPIGNGNEDLNIWQYREHTWVHSFTFQFPRGKSYYPLVVSRDEKLFYRVYDGHVKMELFDTEIKSFETVAHFTGDGDLFFLRVFTYVESLEPARPTRRYAPGLA